LRPDGLRSDFADGFARPSLLGGVEEFFGFIPSRCSKSAIRAFSKAISAA